MGSRCVLLCGLLYLSQKSYGFTGDPVMYLPPFEVRTLRDRPTAVNPNQVSGRSPAQLYPQQPIHHTTLLPPIQPGQPPRLDKEKVVTRNLTLSEILEALNNYEEKDERHEMSRSAYDYPPPPPYGYRPPPYGYQRPNFPPYSYHDTGYSPPAPPAPAHHSASKISLLKPDLTDLVKPVTTKVASKVSGLIGLVLALLTGSSPNDLELKGFKDIVINGIVKPLLLAKGGIKSLISKLTIPVISLLLINLEVLITVWWLWEDCEEASAPNYSYQKPSYGYNSY